jgi:hypothetical protein
VGPEIRREPFHASVVRSPLTRNVDARLSDIQDEITTAFAELIPVKNGKYSDKNILRLLSEDTQSGSKFQH